MKNYTNSFGAFQSKSRFYYYHGMGITLTSLWKMCTYTKLHWWVAMDYILPNHTCKKRKQRDIFPLKVCYQSNIVSNPLCKIFLTLLCNLHNVQNLELKINWGFMKGSDMKIHRRHWVMKKHRVSTLTALDKPPPGHSTDAHCTHPTLTH
jgi:hypothetical protein